jgi:hypothetical protein
VVPKIKDLKFKKQLDYYGLLKDNIEEADKAGQEGLLTKLCRALPPLQVTSYKLQGDPAASWMYECIMGRMCGKPHSPPQARFSRS